MSTGRFAHPKMLAGLASVAGLVVLAGACAPPGPPAPAPDWLLSRGNASVVGNHPALTGAMSLSGDVVAFTSYAGNIAPGATGASDLFVRVRAADTTTRVAGGVTVAPRVSENGRWVSFRDSVGTLSVYDRTTATTQSWNQGGPTYYSVPAVPDDGSVAIYGNQDPFAVNPWSCKVRNLASSATTDCPGPTAAGVAGLEGVSGNGRYVLYAWRDFTPAGASGNYVWDRGTNAMVLVPAALVAYFGGQVSDDGARVTALSTAGSAVTVGVWDRGTNSVLTLPTVPNGTQTMPNAITPDGRFVAYASDADNQVANDTNGAFDVFRWDLSTNTVARASHGAGGAQLPSSSIGCGSGPGQFLGNSSTLCVSTVESLVADDTNGWGDLYAIAD